ARIRRAIALAWHCPDPEHPVDPHTARRAARPLSHLRDRGALRLQPRHPEAVPDRCDQAPDGGRGARHPVAAGDPLADERRGIAVVAVRVGGADRLLALPADDLPGGGDAAVQQVLAAERPRARGARRGAAAPHRLPLARPLRHGRLQALLARQRLLHRLRRREAHRAVRYPGVAPAAGRGGSGARARARPLQAAPCDQGHGAVLGLQLRPALRARRADQAALVLPGAGDDHRHPRGRAAALHAGGGRVHLLPAAAVEPVFAQERVRGRPLRCAVRQSRGAGAGAGQALPRQLRHPDPRPAALRLLRLAPTGGDAHRKIENRMSDFANRKCKPCEGGMKPYSAAEAKELLKDLKGWKIENSRLTKTYAFENYYQTMAFVNALAWVS